MYLNLIKIHYGGLFLILVVLMAQKKQMYIYGSLLSCANYYIDIYLLSVLLTYTPRLWSPSGLTPKL